MPLKVTIIQRILPHYRIHLFKLLQKELEYNNIELNLIYGQELSGTVPRTVELNEPWAYRINNKYFSVANKTLVWQPGLDFLDDSNLVIVEQANSLLLNYWLILKRRFSSNFSIAYWGHGKNMQALSNNTLSEFIKANLINEVDWWFAYTEITKQYIEKAGFPNNKITVLQNAVDATSLSSSIADLPKNKKVIQNQLSLPETPIALYCGGMYHEKNLDFLIESCLSVKQSIPSFQLVMIGDGPEQYKAEQAAKKHNWIHYIGAKFGTERAPYFMVADVFLMPSAIGLAILDCFAAGLPIITTNILNHGPEISYLKDGVNGFIADNTTESYSDAICTFLTSDLAMKSQLESACLDCGKVITIDNMVMRFAEGIKNCIDGGR